MPHDDDNIPDPSEFLFIGDSYDPQLVLKMVTSMSRAMVGMEATVGELAKVSVKTELALEKMANGISDIVLAHNDTKKDIQAINTRIDDRKEENKKQTILIEKLFEKVDKFDNELHTSCDIYNQRNTKYTDDKIAESEARSQEAIKNAVESAYGKVKIGWLISSVSITAIVGLLIYIFSGMKDSINANDLHTRDTKIHLKAK